MKRIRTLIFHPALTPYRIDLFNALAERLDLRVVFMERGVRYDPHVDQRKLLGQLSCDYGVLNTNLCIAGINIRLGMDGEMRAFKPDVVVTHEFSHATFRTILRRLAPLANKPAIVVWTAENSALLAHRSLTRALLLAAGSELADSVVVYSDAMLEEFAAKVGVAREKLFVCANHQEEKGFEAKLAGSASRARQLIADFDLTGKTVILSVGRLSPEKNTGTTLRAFSRLAKGNRDLVLVIVGDGPQKVDLASEAAKLEISNQVVFTGHLGGADLFAWYRAASLFVLASEKEPYGAVVCEALLSGLPVVCSSVAGASVLIEEGKNGRVFNPTEVDRFSSLLKEEVGKAVVADEAVGKKRKSLMPIPFEREVSSFVAAVEHAWRSRTRGRPF